MAPLLPDSDSGNNLEESTDYVTVIDDVIVEDEDKLVISVPEYFTAENRSQRKVLGRFYFQETYAYEYMNDPLSGYLGFT